MCKIVTKPIFCHSPFLFSLAGDCRSVRITRSSNNSQSSVNVSATIPSLIPIHSSAGLVTFHVWTPTEVSLAISTTRLYKVRGWMTPTCDANRFQTARLSATASFISGSNSFTGDVYPLIARLVSWIW